MTYVVLKGMKGCKVGEPCPEAENWKNPQLWVRTGHIALVPDGQEAEFWEALKAGDRKAIAMAPMSAPQHLFSSVRRNKDKVVESVSKAPEPVAVSQPAPDPAPAEPAPADERKFYGRGTLAQMNKDQLADLGRTEFGLDLTADMKKIELIEAITAAQG